MVSYCAQRAVLAYAPVLADWVAGKDEQANRYPSRCLVEAAKWVVPAALAFVLFARVLVGIAVRSVASRGTAAAYLKRSPGHRGQFTSDWYSASVMWYLAVN